MVGLGDRLVVHRLVEELREARIVHHELAVAEQHAAARLGEGRIDRLPQQRRQVLALHARHGVGDGRRRLAGHGDDGRHDVEMRRRLAAALAARELGVHDQHRHVVLLAVGRRALAGEAAVRAQKLAVVGGEDHDGLVGEAEPVELVEDLDDLLVDVADGVEVVVLALAHAPFVVGDQPRQVAVGLVIDAVRGHAARRVERLLPGVLQGNAVPFAAGRACRRAHRRS